MKSNKSVLVGLSGGVDSTVTALKLKESGYEVTGIHLQMWKWHDDAETETIQREKINSICKQIDIPIVHVDVKERFHQTIIDDLKNKLKTGLTPNPCVRCNPLIKYKMLAQFAQELGCQNIATGHYARRIKKPGGSFGIVIPKDKDKDQTYFLCYLTQDVLDKVIFPLGGIFKKEVYSYAEKSGLQFSTETESQDLCFLGNIQYGEYLNEVSDELMKPGEIANENGEILGKHDGLAYFTVGQRKGIRVASEKPYYVIRKDILKNQLIVGFRNEIGFTKIKIRNVNWISGHEPIEDEIGVKIRYQSKLLPSKFEKIDKDFYVVKLQDEVKDPAPGQYAVFYSNDELLGGGEMIETA